MTYYNYVSVKKQVSKLIGEKTALQIKIIADTLQEKFEGINKSTYVLAKTVASFNLDSNEIKKAIRIFLTSRKTIFGSSISLEPYTLGKNIKLFAPYYFRTDTGYRYINLNSNEYKDSDYERHQYSGQGNDIRLYSRCRTSWKDSIQSASEKQSSYEYAEKYPDAWKVITSS